jgi:flagellar hook-length control protein FliK
MSPPAAEVTATSVIDPLVVTATPAAKRAAAGFQEHLRQAEQAVRSPLLIDRESPADSARPESKPAEPSDDRDPAPRNQAGESTAAPAAKRSETPQTDESEPTAQAEQPATADDESPADEPSNSAAEQAAGQAQADAAAKPAEAAAPEETVAVVEAELTAELAAGTGPQSPAPETPAPETPQSRAAQAVAEIVEVVKPTSSTEEVTAPNAESTTIAVAPTNNAAVRPAAENAKVAAQAEAAAPIESPGENPVATATAAAKGAKPEVVVETEEEKPDAEKDEQDSAAGDAAKAAPSATGTVGSTVVDPTAALRTDNSNDERPDSDDKPKDIAVPANDSKPAGHDAARIDAAARTPQGAGATVRPAAAGGGEGTTNLSQVERTRLVQRVAKAVQTAHDRGGELKIRLSPPELGSMKLEVRLHEGVMSARIETETREAQRVLNENLLVLRERLAEQNIKVERFDVDVFNPGAGGGGNAADLAQQQGDGRGEAGGRNGSGSGPREGAPRGDARTSDVRRPAVSTDGRINVVV